MAINVNLNLAAHAYHHVRSSFSKNPHRRVIVTKLSEKRFSQLFMMNARFKYLNLFGKALEPNDDSSVFIDFIFEGKGLRQVTSVTRCLMPWKWLGAILVLALSVVNMAMWLVAAFLGLIYEVTSCPPSLAFLFFEVPQFILMGALECCTFLVSVITEPINVFLNMVYYFQDSRKKVEGSSNYHSSNNSSHTAFSPNRMFQEMSANPESGHPPKPAMIKAKTVDFIPSVNRYEYDPVDVGMSALGMSISAEANRSRTKDSFQSINFSPTSDGSSGSLGSVDGIEFFLMEDWDETNLEHNKLYIGQQGNTLVYKTRGISDQVIQGVITNNDLDQVSVPETLDREYLRDKRVRREILKFTSDKGHTQHLLMQPDDVLAVQNQIDYLKKEEQQASLKNRASFKNTFLKVMLFLSAFCGFSIIPFIAVLYATMPTLLPMGFKFLMPVSASIGHVLSTVPPELAAMSHAVLICFVLMLGIALATKFCQPVRTWVRFFKSLNLGLRSQAEIGAAADVNQLKFVHAYEAEDSALLSPLDANTALHLGDRTTFVRVDEVSRITTTRAQSLSIASAPPDFLRMMPQ